MKKRSWRGSTLQSLMLIVAPLALLLVAVSFGSFQVHQNAMRSLVGSRDERSARTAAGALEAAINHRLYEVRVLATLAASDPAEAPAAILKDPQGLLADLDYGTAFFDRGGGLVAASRGTELWGSLQNNPELGQALGAPSASVLGGTFPEPASGKPVILVSAPVSGGSLVAMGAFTPENAIQGSLQDIFPAGDQMAVYIIDSGGEILYHGGPDTLEGDPGKHAGVSEALQGKSGSTFVRAGTDEHVVAFSPVPLTGWAIITEESWQAVSNSTLGASQLIPLILVPALLLALLALWFGSQQIVRPLQKLEAKAARLAWGDFEQIEERVGGIAEIRDLQDELAHMAAQLRAAEQSLHSYIGAITQGQESERLRLARELHDDTIQSLIALKQRVQLAQMPGRSGPAPDLKELESLIEGTIEDLRRATRALRPIYLEDLGLTAALEMLATETGASSGLRIELKTSGAQRRLPVEAELALYRMVQEALNNAVQHAQADQVTIRLDFRPKELQVEVSDDGKGFEPPHTPGEFSSGGHFGLLGLYERAALIGAQLEIHSSRNGTQIKISYPTLPDSGTSSQA